MSIKNTIKNVGFSMWLYGFMVGGVTGVVIAFVLMALNIS